MYLYCHTQQDFRIKVEFHFWQVSFCSSYASIRAGLGSVAGITRAQTDPAKRELKLYSKILLRERFCVDLHGIYKMAFRSDTIAIHGNNIFSYFCLQEGLGAQ